MTKKPKKSKAPLPFADARKACRTPAEQDDLARVIKARWTSAELSEYARLYFFRNGRDFPTPTSYRRAMKDIAGGCRWSDDDEEPSYHQPLAWVKLFRKRGSKPMGPRRDGLLKRGRGETLRVSSAEYAWPGHTEKFRAMIEQQARDYFGITPKQQVHVNAWAASQRAYWREKSKVREEAERKAKALKKAKAPKSPTKPNRRKLAPQFNMEWVGHTDAFREEVAVLARKDKGLPSDAYIGPAGWKRACNKYYDLTEGTPT
ncbi:hypothetical protein JQ629_35630 [Bradyrhizobium sp. AUGA SZCCT0222]|uniref:hypothetical protein n=1 Tax=Bradyrhizobium sp. AUGA SZCCT0222 TaxID=2807668 RepID=UPI001BA5EA99|nr:hypothetical protein [Bradyrhizobium sp. AUGA SZCCT0222]MBR1272818.1 hypothetical protein [Bradyrhizobium sp. AUGA SZCCT0222]